MNYKKKYRYNKKSKNNKTCKKLKYKSKKNNLKNKSNKKYSRLQKRGGTNLEIFSINDIIPILSNYSNIYIAIGAKFQPDNYPPEIENTGIYQLVPEFILDQDVKTLIIIIDQFNEDELNKNKKVIEKRIRVRTEDEHKDEHKDELELNKTENKQIDYIIINQLLDRSIINKLKNLINVLDDSQNIYISNYVYFFNPNDSDIIIERQIDTLLDELLQQLKLKLGTETLPVNKNVYKWLGNIEPSYICRFNLYVVVSRQIALKKRVLNEVNVSQINKILSNNCIKIN